MSLVVASPGARRLWGTLFLLALIAAGTGVLLASGRTLGRGIHVEVEVASTGALKADAKVKLAGQVIGQVRGMHREASPTGESHVILDCFITADAAPHLRANSDLFIATPSVLGEAYLEVGPAHGKVEPGPPVADGQRLRGADPPEIDRMLARLYHDMTTIVLLLRQYRPTVDELLHAGAELLAELSGLPADEGQLRRIGDQVARLAADGAELVSSLSDGNAVPRMRALARDLGETADRVAPDLVDLARRVERAIDRVDEVAAIFTPERRAAVSHGLDALSHALDVGQQINNDIRYLTDKIARGEGSVGAFLADRELYDDLHATGHILKQEFWRVLDKRSPTEPVDTPFSGGSDDRRKPPRAPAKGSPFFRNLTRRPANPP
jgi:MlaD protein